MAKETRLRCSLRSRWYGAAARMVASNAISAVSSFTGLAWMYRPRFVRFECGSASRSDDESGDRCVLRACAEQEIVQP